MKTTEPLPVPLVPAVIVIQLAPAVALHEQPGPAATNTVEKPLVAETLRLEGLREKVQAAPS